MNWFRKLIGDNSADELEEAKGRNERARKDLREVMDSVLPREIIDVDDMLRGNKQDARS